MPTLFSSRREPSYLVVAAALISTHCSTKKNSENDKKRISIHIVQSGKENSPNATSLVPITPAFIGLGATGIDSVVLSEGENSVLLPQKDAVQLRARLLSWMQDAKGKVRYYISDANLTTNITSATESIDLVFPPYQESTPINIYGVTVANKQASAGWKVSIIDPYSGAKFPLPESVGTGISDLNGVFSFRYVFAKPAGNMKVTFEGPAGQLVQRDYALPNTLTPGVSMGYLNLTGTENVFLGKFADDYDGDGIKNLDEAALGTNPFAVNLQGCVEPDQVLKGYQYTCPDGRSLVGTLALQAGANCYDALGDVNGDGQINTLDCRGPAGPAGAPGPAGATGATGPAGTPGGNIKIRLTTSDPNVSGAEIGEYTNVIFPFAWIKGNPSNYQNDAYLPLDADPTKITFFRVAANSAAYNAMDCSSSGYSFTPGNVLSEGLTGYLRPPTSMTPTSTPLLVRAFSRSIYTSDSVPPTIQCKPLTSKVRGVHKNGSTLFAATDGAGLMVSENNGTTWTWHNSLGGFSPGGDSLYTAAGVGNRIWTMVSAGNGSSSSLKMFDYNTSTHAGTWSSVTGISSQIDSIAQVSSNYFAVSSGQVYTSPNGTTWTSVPVDNSASTSWKQVISRNSNQVWIVGSDGMAVSFDGGTTWRQHQGVSPFDSSYNNISDIDSKGSVIAVATYSGKGIYYSFNNGVTWKNYQPSDLSDSFSSITITGANNDKIIAVSDKQLYKIDFSTPTPTYSQIPSPLAGETNQYCHIRKILAANENTYLVQASLDCDNNTIRSQANDSGKKIYPMGGYIRVTKDTGTTWVALQQCDQGNCSATTSQMYGMDISNILLTNTHLIVLRNLYGTPISKDILWQRISNLGHDALSTLADLDHVQRISGLAWPSSDISCKQEGFSGSPTADVEKLSGVNPATSTLMLFCGADTASPTAFRVIKAVFSETGGTGSIALNSIVNGISSLPNALFVSKEASAVTHLINSDGSINVYDASGTPLPSRNSPSSGQVSAFAHVGTRDWYGTQSGVAVWDPSIAITNKYIPQSELYTRPGSYNSYSGGSGCSTCLSAITASGTRVFIASQGSLLFSDNDGFTWKKPSQGILFPGYVTKIIAPTASTLVLAGTNGFSYYSNIDTGTQGWQKYWSDLGFSSNSDNSGSGDDFPRIISDQFKDQHDNSGSSTGNGGNCYNGYCGPEFAIGSDATSLFIGHDKGIHYATISNGTLTNYKTTGMIFPTYPTTSYTLPGGTYPINGVQMVHP